MLTIESATLDDRKEYTCSGTNIAVQYGNADYTVATEVIFVRVKGSYTAPTKQTWFTIYNNCLYHIGKLAALWPFLGICAEVFILCAIILVYEKRRNKAEMDESDTDQSPEQ